MNRILKVFIRYVALVAFFSVFTILREKEIDVKAAVIISLSAMAFIIVFDLLALLLNVKFNKFYNKYVYILAMIIILATDLLAFFSATTGETDAGFALFLAFVAPVYIFPSAIVLMFLIGVFDKEGRLHG